MPYPDFDVDLYAKGGYFNKPSVMGIGEQGPEMALPLVGKRMRPFADAVARNINKTKEASNVSGQRVSNTTYQYSINIENVHGTDRKAADKLTSQIRDNFLRKGFT